VSRRLPNTGTVAVAFLLLFLFACSGRDGPSDRNVAVAKGEPSFTPLGTYWTIDNMNPKALEHETVVTSDAILQRLKEEGIAEVVIIVQPGVRSNAADWATKYGRWLGLGRRGLSTDDGNRGLVWLIRPDADQKVTVSVGRGLPKFTSSDYGPILERVAEYLNFGNVDKGVMVISQETDRILRQLYEHKSENKP
jgi:hypothetical protein